MLIRTIDEIRRLLETGDVTGGITDPEGDIVQMTAEDGSKLDLHLGRSFGDRLPSDDEIIDSIEGIAERGSFDVAPVDRTDAETDAVIRIDMTHKILDDGLSPMEALAYVVRRRTSSNADAANSMICKTGRRISVQAVAKYLTLARDKLDE